MAVLTRNFNWATTPVGPPERWSNTLRTVVSMMLHSDFPMFLWWGPDMIQFYNDAYRPSMGHSGKHPTALGQTGKECWPEIWDTIYPLIRQVQVTRKSFFIEDQLIPIFRNGRLEDVWWTFSYSAIIGESGDVAGVLVICNETTKNVEAVEQLKVSRLKQEENQARIQALVASAPFPIAVYEGREMRISMANQAIVDVWGKGDEWIGNTYYALLPELASQQIYPALDSVFTTGIPFHARNQQVDLVVNGKLTQFYFNYSFTPLFDSSGKVYGVLNTAADVTDLNIVKQRLEQSEANFRNMIVQAPVAMCIMTGPDHVVEIANDLMIELWGKPKEAVMNKPIFQGLPDAREQGLEKLLHDVYHTGVPFKASERPVELIRKGKVDIVYQNFVYEPYRDSDGKIVGVLAITIDVTDQVSARMKIEEIVADRTAALETSNKDLQRSNAELAQFAYIASHDLQEPLRKIRTFAQMLEKSLAGVRPDLSKEYLDKIQTSSRRMESLIRDVLTYSEVNKETELFTDVDLNTIVDDVKSDFEVAIEQGQASITFDRLPVIEAIQLQMSQLFSNLISNALKFAKPGVTSRVEITSSQPSDADLRNAGLSTGKEYCLIKVSDNGIGFDQAFSDRIFHIFQRLHRKAEFEGTGIGLAICKKIVLNHEGSISAEGTQGHGATFSIILPLKQH